MVSKQLAVNILGPLDVHVEGKAIALGRGLRPRLLAWLALNQGTSISVERTVEALWPDADFATCRSRLAGVLWSARRIVGPADLGVTRRGAHLVVTLDPGQVDASLFESSIRRSQHLMRRTPMRAATELSSALALWRGQPYPELEHDPDGVAERFRLETLRVDALEHLHGLRLLLGPAPGLAAEIAALVQANPTRELSWRQLIAALQAADRHVEALRAFHDCRRALISQGLTPTPQSRAVERAVVEGRLPDASLLLPPHREHASLPKAPTNWATELVQRWRTEPLGRLVIVEVADASDVSTAAQMLRAAADLLDDCVIYSDADDPTGAVHRTRSIEELTRVARLAQRMPAIILLERSTRHPGNQAVLSEFATMVISGSPLLLVAIESPEAPDAPHLRSLAKEILRVDPKR